MISSENVSISCSFYLFIRREVKVVCEFCFLLLHTLIFLSLFLMVSPPFLSRKQTIVQLEGERLVRILQLPFTNVRVDNT